MGLKLKLKPKERLIINGCIVRNGEKRLDIEIENRADVLRGNEMMSEEDANTPVRRLCFMIQLALVSRELRPQILPEIMSQIDQLGSIFSKSSSDVFEQVRRLVEEGEFYSACRKLGPIIVREELLLSLPLGKQ